jgi:phosphatidylglycerophosphate synthase
MRKLADALVRPLARFLHLGLGLSPSQVTWISFAVSLAAASAIGFHRLGLGLALMAAGQVFDGLDGAIAREFGLQSEEGHRLDTLLDRASETIIFVSMAGAGFVPVPLALMAIIAVLLLTTVCDRSGLDPGFKRFPLYFGHWVPYPVLFEIIFGANLTAYVVGLLVIDCKFQMKMDALGGDLDTVASRAAAIEEAEERLAEGEAEELSAGRTVAVGLMQAEPLPVSIATRRPPRADQPE